jgi:hypothetical protein
MDRATGFDVLPVVDSLRSSVAVTSRGVAGSVAKLTFK